MRCSRALIAAISRLTASSPTRASMTSAYLASGSPVELQRLHRQLGHERLRPLVRRRFPQLGGPLPRAAAAGRRAAARRDQPEHRAVHGRGERLRAEGVELGPAQRGPLHGELQRLPLHPDNGIAQVVGLAAGPPAGPPARPPPFVPNVRAARPGPPACGPGRPAAPGPGVARVRPHPGQHEPLVHHAEPAVQVDRVPGAQPLVLDPGHDRRGLVQRGELPFGGVQVVPGRARP